MFVIYSLQILLFQITFIHSPFENVFNYEIRVRRISETKRRRISRGINEMANYTKFCWRIQLTLRLLISYIYGAPSKARNANVVYIWTYVWQR